MIDLLSRKLNEELFCCYNRTWTGYQHFVLWFKHNKKTGYGKNKSMGCRTNCKRSRNKRRSHVSRLRPCNRTCSFWDIIWCVTPVTMNGRYLTTEEHDGETNPIITENKCKMPIKHTTTIKAQHKGNKKRILRNARTTPFVLTGTMLPVSRTFCSATLIGGSARAFFSVKSGKLSTEGTDH